MTSFAVIDPETGRIISIGRTDVDSLECLAGGGRFDVVAPVPVGVSPLSHFWTGEAFTALPQRPGPWAVWTGSEWGDPRTPEELQAEIDAKWGALRAERDRRLAATDWTQFPDAPLTDVQREAWRTYRQALRDIPDATQDPASPEWPELPT